MADLLANMAMDSKKSMQVQLDMEQLRLTQWRPLVDFAGGDIGHWLLKNADMGTTGALADTL
jgi:hypothetical protein